MIVITVVYASDRLFERSSTTSRTVARRRFQSRSMTAVSRGPRNAFGPSRRARLRRRTSSGTIELSRLPLRHAAPLEEPRMALAEQLAAVGQRDVERDDEVTVAGRVEGTARRVAALDE